MCRTTFHVYCMVCGIWQVIFAFVTAQSAEIQSFGVHLSILLTVGKERAYPAQSCARTNPWFRGRILGGKCAQEPTPGSVVKHCWFLDMGGEGKLGVGVNRCFAWTFGTVAVLAQGGVGYYDTLMETCNTRKTKFWIQSLTSINAGAYKYCRAAVKGELVHCGGLFPGCTFSGMPQPQYITSKSIHNPATPQTPNQKKFACTSLPQNLQSETVQGNVTKSMAYNVTSGYALTGVP